MVIKKEAKKSGSKKKKAKRKKKKRKKRNKSPCYECTSVTSIQWFKEVRYKEEEKEPKNRGENKG